MVEIKQEIVNKILHIKCNNSEYYNNEIKDCEKKH